MSIFPILLAGALDGCAGSPSAPTSVSATTNVLNNCASNGWNLTWTVVAAGPLGFNQEYWWEEATNSGGTNWSFVQRGTGTTFVGNVGEIGSDGPEPAVTRFRKVRVRVVPTGGDDTNACTSATTSSQVSRTANACVA
jgi:hypothetical protein